MEDPQLVSIEDLLQGMEVPQLTAHFVRNGVGVTELLSLRSSSVPILLPEPDFNIGHRLNFIQKYCTFMSTNHLELHASFEPVDSNHNLNASLSQSSSKASSRHLDTGDNSNQNSDSVTGDEHAETNLSDCGDISYNPGEDLDGRTSSDDDELALSVYRKKTAAGNSKACRRQSEGQSETHTRVSILRENESSSQSDISEQQRPSTSSAKPLVDASQIGAKRKMSKAADSTVDDLDLEALWKEDPVTGAIITAYAINKFLSDDDRSNLTKTLISWLLKQTEYPSQRQYEILTEKLVKIFPTEKESVWYSAPFTESERQRYPKGRLYDKVKNVKSKLRSKGYLHTKKQKRSSLPLSSTQPDSQTEEERTAIEWLRRNLEPFSDVKMYWNRCGTYRLRELYSHDALSPGEYITRWKDILKLPEGKQLVLDDFEILPDAITDGNFECLRGKSEGLLMKWNEFSTSLILFLKSSGCNMTAKEKKSFLNSLEKAPNENTRDYIILQILASICKQKGRICVGKKTIKPSAQESKDAFILFVPGAGEFDNALRLRQDRYNKLGATIQPYLLVLGNCNGGAGGGPSEFQELSVVSSYVIINQVPWRTSSILQAVDLCFKSFFALNASYPPEAKHLWLFVQIYFYGAQLKGDHCNSSVTSLLCHLQAVSDN